MLYLINEEQRKRIMKKYYGSVAQVISWFLIGLCVMISILSIPTMLMLQTEVGVSTDKITLSENEIQKAKAENPEEEAIIVTNKINILKEVYPINIREKYIAIQEVLESVPGVSVTTITIDTLTKTVQIVTQVKDKDVAKELVDALNKSKYKGANLPYAVLSQKASFVFAQNLTYE